MLEWAKWLAIGACVVLVALWLWISVHWGYFLLGATCFTVADLPRLTGAGYNGDVIDRPGVILAFPLIIIIFVVY